MLAALALLAACGDRATLSVREGTGSDPVLPEPHKTLLPTVNIAPAKGWPDGTTPQAAAGLRRLGLEPGDRVGTLLANHVEFVDLMVAGSLLGWAIGRRGTAEAFVRADLAVLLDRDRAARGSTRSAIASRRASVRPAKSSRARTS